MVEDVDAESVGALAGVLCASLDQIVGDGSVAGQRVQAQLKGEKVLVDAPQTVDGVVGGVRENDLLATVVRVQRQLVLCSERGASG